MGKMIRCPVCGSSEINRFFSLDGIPVHCHLLWADRKSALAVPRGDIRLGFCCFCGHIFNFGFNPELMNYNTEYENSLHYSPHFQDYATGLAKHLISKYDLYGKELIEIGSGKGEFLTMLCELGGNHGVGFDPSYRPTANGKDNSANVEFVLDFYSERYQDYQADLIYSRQTLEHLKDPKGFVKTIRYVIGKRPSTVVFFEVPNARWIIDQLSIWDIIYEHYSYFSKSSLEYVVVENGFEREALDETYGAQFLTIEAVPTVQPRPSAFPQLDGWRQAVDRFSNQFEKKMEDWQARIESLKHTGKRAVIWGAGSKGISLLNFLNIQDEIEYVIDINPKKTGKFIAGTGQLIVPPRFLREYQPEVVILLNPLYREEIERSIHTLGLEVDYWLA